MGWILKVVAIGYGGVRHSGPPITTRSGVPTLPPPRSDTEHVRISSRDVEKPDMRISALLETDVYDFLNTKSTEMPHRSLNKKNNHHLEKLQWRASGIRVSVPFKGSTTEHWKEPSSN